MEAAEKTEADPSMSWLDKKGTKESAKKYNEQHPSVKEAVTAQKGEGVGAESVTKFKHPHSRVDAPVLTDAVGYAVEIDSHEPDAMEGDAFPATIHAVNVEKGTVTVSYEVDDGAPPDYQEMDYYSKDIAWIKAP